jgi:hypothetical protein
MCVLLLCIYPSGWRLMTATQLRCSRSMMDEIPEDCMLPMLNLGVQCLRAPCRRSQTYT